MILKEHLQPNPIIIKELRSRMRGARAFIILTTMLLVLAGALYGIYRLMTLANAYTTVPGPIIGQTLFQSLIVLELLIICLITPALTAGAISSEREKLTYEMLLTTPLSPARILWGKLISALSYVLLLIFAAIPIASLVFLFGGVTPMQMLRGLFVLAVVAILMGTIGIFMSAWLGRTGRATVVSYLFVLILFIAPIVAAIAVGIYHNDAPPRELLIANPASALFSATLPAQLSPMMGMGFTGGLGFALAGNFDILDGNVPILPPRPLYHYSLPLYAAMTIFFYLLAMQFVKPTQRWHINWRASIPVFIIIGLLAALVGFGFWSTSDQYARASNQINQLDEMPNGPVLKRVPVDPEPPGQEALPARPEIPVQAELPAGPEIPVQAELPTGPEIPVQAELPAGPEIPVQAELPAGPEIPVQAELPAGPEIPVQPEILTEPGIPIGPATVEVSPTLPALHEVPTVEIPTAEEPASE